MKIGELASRVGVPVETVRFYERSGLMPPPARRASGYREYDSQDIWRLRFVLRTKALGFTLVEIRELLALCDRASEDNDELRCTAEAKLVDIETRLSQLGQIRDALQAVVNKFPRRSRAQDLTGSSSLTSATRSSRLVASSAAQVLDESKNRQDQGDQEQQAEQHAGSHHPAAHHVCIAHHS